jgi:uncharacterized membrane protein
VSSALVFVSAFLASAVELVEALTIVLAVGVARGWRSTLVGVSTAVLALALVVLVLGPSLQRLPIESLRLAVGSLLICFGLQWLRKAILRASGYKAMRDETQAFCTERARATTAPRSDAAGLDGYAFTVAFKGVLLEGFEVAFIVATIGTTQRRLGLAAGGATAAFAIVATVGLLVRAPLARVPENTVKLMVGLLLTSFGAFWAGEGTGIHWPGNDLFLPALLAYTSALTLMLTRLLTRQRRALQSLGADT